MVDNLVDDLISLVSEFLFSEDLTEHPHNHVFKFMRPRWEKTNHFVKIGRQRKLIADWRVEEAYVDVAKGVNPMVRGR